MRNNNPTSSLRLVALLVGLAAFVAGAVPGLELSGSAALGIVSAIASEPGEQAPPGFSPESFSLYANRLGVSEDVLGKMVNLLIDRKAPAERWGELLDAAASWYNGMQETLGALESIYPEEQRLLWDARNALDDFRLDEVIALLELVNALEIERAKRASPIAKVKILQVAIVTSVIASAQMIQMRYDNAAASFAEAAEWLPSMNQSVLPHLIMKQGKALTDAGRLEEAVSAFTRCISTSTKILGQEHPLTASVQGILADLLKSMGRLAEAVPHYQRALASREKAFGLEHAFTVDCMSNLGRLYYTLKRLAEAEPLLRRALAIREKVLGPVHPITAISLNDLGVLYSDTDRLAEAEPLLQRALAIRWKVLGPEHPDTVVSCYSLGALLLKLGRESEARRFLDWAATAKAAHRNP